MSSGDLIRCRMCGQLVDKRDYMPGIRKCSTCLETTKRALAARPGAHLGCLRVIYDRFWNDNLPGIL